MFSLSKFLNGFNILNGEVRGKILYYAILISVGCFILWATFIRPTTKQTQDLKKAFNGANIGVVNVGQTTTVKHWAIGPVITIDRNKKVNYGVSVMWQF